MLEKLGHRIKTVCGDESGIELGIMQLYGDRRNCTRT